MFLSSLLLASMPRSLTSEASRNGCGGCHLTGLVGGSGRSGAGWRFDTVQIWVPHRLLFESSPTNSTLTRRLFARGCGDRIGGTLWNPTAESDRHFRPWLPPADKARATSRVLQGIADDEL